MRSFALLLLLLSSALMTSSQFLPTMASLQPSTIKQLEQLNADYKQLAQYIKINNPTLSDEQKGLLKTAKALLVPYLDAKQKGLIPIHTATNLPHEEDVELGDFVNTCMQWRKTMKTFLNQATKDYAGVHINIESFKNDLAENQSTLPIIQDLYKEWIIAVDQLSQQGDTTTGAILFTTLRDQNGPAWSLTSDVEGLKQHYRKNRRVYKQISSGSASLKGYLPSSKAFLDALAASTSDDDPNLPEHKEDAKEDAKADLDRMVSKWDNWLNNQLIPRLEETDTSTKGKLIDVILLERNRTNYMRAPSYANDMWETVGTTIVSKVKAIEGTASYDQVIMITVKIVQDQFDTYVDDDFIQTAVASGEHSLPSGLKRWLEYSIAQDDELYDQLGTICSEWASTVQDLTGEAEKANKNRSFQVVRKKWEQELKHLFTGPTQPLVQPILAQLPTTEILSLYQVQQGWKEGLTVVQQSDFLTELWTDGFTRNSHQAGIESLLTAFKTNLPQRNQLAQQLLNAQYFPPEQTPKPLMDYAQTDTVQTRFAISWNDVRILVGSGLQELSEETGLESIAEHLAGMATGNWDVDTTSGIENIGLRATSPMNLDLKIPLQLRHHKHMVLAVPTVLDRSMVKFVGGSDGHYALTVQRIAINTQPRFEGTTTIQEILVTLEIEDPQLSISMSGSAVFAGVAASVTKNPTKTSVDLVFVLTQNYLQDNNQIQLQFTEVQLVENSRLIQSVALMNRPTQTLQVYR